MIRTIEFGKTSDVIEVLFEKGDIMMSRVTHSDGTHGIAFSQYQGEEIGAVSNDYSGETTDALPAPIRVLFTFTNPKSVNALIHSLSELQKDILDGTHTNTILAP